MKATQRKPSQAVKDGRAAGAWLAETAADVLLQKYSARPIGTQSQASTRWSEAWDLLRDALGVMTDDPDVVGALKALDDAHGDALVEQEDSAWHAAWTLAMRLRSN